MGNIRGSNTKPELTLRSMLHGLGYRFTVNGVRNKKLPGKPDIIVPKYRTIVLVHGCFWHGHENCSAFRPPETRQDWWMTKIEGNRARDARIEKVLTEMGWNVVTIWECALKTEKARKWLETRLPALIGRRV